MKKLSIEYAHIYTNSQINGEHEFSLKILKESTDNLSKEDISLVVMVDDYSFPDPSFDYENFSQWLTNEGFHPDVLIRESELIPACDQVVDLINDIKLRNELIEYIHSKKYPCSLFIATWYLIRLGCIDSPLFSRNNTGWKLLNILPKSFQPFEEKGFEIISKTPFADKVQYIENKYFEGRNI